MPLATFGRFMPWAKMLWEELFYATNSIKWSKMSWLFCHQYGKQIFHVVGVVYVILSLLLAVSYAGKNIKVLENTDSVFGRTTVNFVRQVRTRAVA